MQLINIEQVSQMIGFKKPTIYQWVSQGKMPSVKIGNRLRFEKEVVEKWICSLRK